MLVRSITTGPITIELATDESVPKADKGLLEPAWQADIRRLLKNYAALKMELCGYGTAHQCC
jgi:hypothetical protein